MSQLHCPHCGGRQLQVATNTRFSTSTNVTRKQVTTTVSSQNTRYWCCADCGSTFPFPQDVQQQAEALANNAAFIKSSSIFTGIGGVFFLLFAAAPDIGGLMATMSIISFLSAAVCAFVAAPSELKKSEQLQAEYEDLISKCMD